VSSDAPERFAVGATVLLDEDTARPLTVETSRTQGERTIVKFAEIDDRTAAEELKGAELVIPLAEARELSTDEYWDHDLIGCAVVTVDGEQVGEVTDVLHQPTGSLLTVSGENGDHLVPLIKDVIRSVTPGLRITIDPIPGLLGD
jgi:16S rRNA processing protein RimM